MYAWARLPMIVQVTAHRHLWSLTKQVYLVHLGAKVGTHKNQRKQNTERILRVASLTSYLFFSLKRAKHTWICLLCLQ